MVQRTCVSLYEAQNEENQTSGDVCVESLPCWLAQAESVLLT